MLVSTDLIKIQESELFIRFDFNESTQSKRHAIGIQKGLTRR